MQQIDSNRDIDYEAVIAKLTAENLASQRKNERLSYELKKH